MRHRLRKGLANSYPQSCAAYFLHQIFSTRSITCCQRKTTDGQSCGQNERCGGSRIIPFSPEKAKEFGEKNMDADTYESVFGPVEE